MDERRKRLTHDDPQGMVEALHNTAFVKDREVWLRGAGEDEQDVTLTKYCAARCRFRCGIDIADVPAEEFGDHMDCDCVVCWFYLVATGAAEMREKLKQYEDCFQDPAHVREILRIIEEERSGKIGG